MNIAKPETAPLLVENVMRFFPEGYTPRPQQAEAIAAIERAYRSGKRAVVLEAPPGSGKSHISMTFARATRASGGSTSILSSQRILQDQVEELWPSPEIEVLKGRNNYSCAHPAAKAGDRADHAPCTRKDKAILSDCCEGGDFRRIVGLRDAASDDTICPYWKQLILAARSPVTLFNFRSFLAQQRIKRFGVRDLLITDEAHNVENELKAFVELTLPEKLLMILHIQFHAGLQTAAQVVKWVRDTEIVKTIEGKLEEVEAGGISSQSWSSLGESYKAGTKELLEDLKIRLEIFLAHFQKAEWIVRIEYRGRHRERVLTAKPVFGAGFGETLLWSKGRRILAASATILDKDAWCASVGLDPAQVELVQIGSDFPKENRPIYREYVGSMARADKDATLPKLIALIRDTLLPRYAGKRGIVHTHSFQIAQAIVAGVGSDRLLLHGEGQDKREILRQHAAREDSVIVAPAFHEGVDLKDDLARFQIIAKIPYPNLGDEVVAARKAMDDGNAWYSWQTALKLIQTYGRPVRSKDDHADTYVTDDGLERFLQRAWPILPKWFKEALSVRKP